MTFARWERPVVNDAGDLITNAYVEVRRETAGFPLAAPIYEDFEGDTTLANPFPATDGIAAFHAVGGFYRIRIYAPGYERTLRYVPIGTAQAADIDAYASAGFTWAPESGTSAPPATGAIRFNNADASLATHIYVSQETLSGSDAGSWLTGLAPGAKSVPNLLLLSTSDSEEASWQVSAASDAGAYIDLTVTGYVGPAGPVSFGDAGFITLSREISGNDGEIDLSVNDRTSLKAIDTTTQTVALLKEAGREGTFTFKSGDYAARIAADTAEGIYIKANAIAAASGAWVRVYSGAVDVKWFGAKGDNVTDDATALNAAIAYANSLTFPNKLLFSSGFYYSTAALTAITGPTWLEGVGSRASIITFDGNFDCITFAGSASRCSNAGVRDMGFYASDMTGGVLFELDWTQDITLENVFVSDAFNFMSIRQAGNTQLINLDVGPLRGTYGVKGYGAGGSRNGETDKIDVISITNTTIQNAASTSLANSTAYLIWLDGYVQTLDLTNVRLLCGKHAIYTTDTPTVGQPLWPSFITGLNVQIENPYLDGVRAEKLNTMEVSGLFIVGSATANGMYCGVDTDQINIFGGRIAGNYLHGAEFDGASNVTLIATNVYNNSQVGSGVKSGIYLGNTSVETFAMIGGNSGKLRGVGSYTENQKYGIDVNAASRALAMGVDLNGNVTGAYTGTISVFEDSVASGALVAAASAIGFTARSRVKSSADGLLTLLNAAETGFTRLNLGGTTASFPALKVISATLAAVLGDDSAYTMFGASYLRINDGVTAPGTAAGAALIYVDSADGDLKVKFGDGTTKTIMVDT